MLKKVFISAILLLAVLSFVVSLLKGKNNDENKANVTTPDRVAVINIFGTITSGPDMKDNPFQEQRGISSGRIIKELRDAAKDKTVKAVVLRIDSGGGSATAAEEVERELKRFKEKTNKPIVATMGDMGCSAAYWIAVCHSDIVYANNSTLTGSIGVYMPYMNLEELMKKVGVKTSKIKSGAHKDIMAYDRPMTKDEEIIMQNIVNEIYDDFLDVVAKGRKLDRAIVKSYADGRIFTGKQARSYRLIDEIGDYYDALAMAGELGKIKPGEDGLPPVKSAPQKQAWEYLLGAHIAEVVKTELVQQLHKDLGADMVQPALR